MKPTTVLCSSSTAAVIAVGTLKGDSFVKRWGEVRLHRMSGYKWLTIRCAGRRPEREAQKARKVFGPVLSMIACLASQHSKA